MPSRITIALAMLATACVENERLVIVRVPDTPPPVPSVADSFSIHAGEAEVSRPRPRLQRSISLGYVGDEPLSGGVTRDTPLQPWQGDPWGGQTWQQYIHNPAWPPAYVARCSCPAFAWNVYDGVPPLPGCHDR